MARDRDDDYDDRPRRRDDDDDYDDRPRRPARLGPLDKTFRDTNIVVLVLFGFCCGIIALALSLVCLLTAKDEKAKSNAMIVVIVSGLMTVIGVGLQLTGILAGGAAGRR
jgi:hypothetical protein